MDDQVGQNTDVTENGVDVLLGRQATFQECAVGNALP